MPDPIPLRGVSLHDGVAARLRAMVFDGALNPGDWIDEKALADAWQVSRTPLREALNEPHRVSRRLVSLSQTDTV